MRTYTRKKPEHQTIEGVQELCRLCLEKVDAAVPIFSNDSDDVCGSLSLRIMICVGLEMSREESLPNMICAECYKELERYYAFRKKCEVSYQKLKSHVLAVKEKEQIRTTEVKKEKDVEVEGFLAEPQGDSNVQHLVLTFNDEQQVELVNVVNLNSIQLENLQELNKKMDSTTIGANVEEDVNEVQMQDISTTNPSPATLEIEGTHSDMSLIVSTILLELSVLQQQGDRLVLADENLTTIELEGDDNTKVVLELAEEDEEQIAISAAEESRKYDSLEANAKAEQISPPEDAIPKKKQFVLDLPGTKTKQSKAECNECGKRFVSRSVLARHMRVHSGERPHACNVCGRRFAQREVMTRHQLVHQESRPFKCRHCPRSFTQRGALAGHARTHAPPHARALTLHACAACDKVFLYASGLSRHMSTHSGRVFACGACGRHFRDKSSLLRHLRNMHHRDKHQVPPEPQ